MVNERRQPSLLQPERRASHQAHGTIGGRPGSAGGRNPNCGCAQHRELTTVARWKGTAIEFPAAQTQGEAKMIARVSHPAVLMCAAGVLLLLPACAGVQTEDGRGIQLHKIGVQ